jgi:hypothetical protein
MPEPNGRAAPGSLGRPKTAGASAQKIAAESGAGFQLGLKSHCD